MCEIMILVFFCQNIIKIKQSLVSQIITEIYTGIFLKILLIQIYIRKILKNFLSYALVSQPIERIIEQEIIILSWVLNISSMNFL
ncbi:hypothetical protein GXY_08789 [Novacetimonas hansenii ATCC 23769]|uniref:Transmembrane protein n=1 Tax=Novacetimonas hansenii ATCC 23769 TaxID=714995 RepID=D5QF42_NOVHA|nr:hypothetical protein GXY_08789 [Novacetimonas hansenii ATCC 23769]